MNGSAVFDNVVNTLVVNDGTALTGTGLTVATIGISEPGVAPVISGVRVFALAGVDAGAFAVLPDGLGGNVLKFIGGGPASFANFEAKPVYHVTVNVTDNLGTDAINYTLNVTDTNDNRATIISGNHVNVQENINTNVVAYRVAGTDLDTVGPALSYSLVAGVGGEDNLKFTMVGNNGEIRFVASPNFELPTDADFNNVYNVLVGVSDGVGVTTKAVQIAVSNVAEGGPNVPPTITSNGGGATAATSINENLTAVTTVTATDTDLPAQALTFSLVAGNDSAKFTINPTSGALSFLTAPNFEAPTDIGLDNVYDVTVRVSDGAGGFDTQAIAVTVNNVVVENVPPVINSNGGLATASVNVAENSTAVTTVVATDADLPAQALAYSIIGGADALAFNINPTTGALLFNTAPNFEAPTDIGGNNVYDVNVQVSDGNGGLDSQAVAVTVTNVVPETITGDANANALNGTADADIILGLDGDDTIHGNGGNDTITGGLGQDALFGDAGADTFVFDSVTETPTGFANRDVIGDFVHLTDTMDLTAIDAKTGVAGNQSFKWIGTQAFHHVKGELHYTQAGGDTTVSGDRNGDGVADFQIELIGLVTVNVSDFNL
jgi:serralysin